MNADFLMNDEVTRLSKEVAAAKGRLREALQRATPEPVADVELRRGDGSAVLLSALFGGRKQLVLWHNMGRSCVYCTLWADSLRGYAEHLQDRAALALTSPDAPQVLDSFARSRGWAFPCVSVQGTGLLRALRMCGESGDPWPGVSALERDASETITRSAYTYFGPGDDFCPLWPALDLLRGGAAGWAPKLSYGPNLTSVGVEHARG